jgi:hypothetical protein
MMSVFDFNYDDHDHDDGDVGGYDNDDMYNT